MGTFVTRASAAALSLLLVAPCSADDLPQKPTPFDIKPGQELTIPVAVVDGQVVVGAPRLSKLGTAAPKDGEITVGLTPATPGSYTETVTATEKTAAPIDFLATGVNAYVKIDEAVICGRLDAPSSARIALASWRVVLRGFEVGKGGPSCP
ncbi:MAG: hypothetical protein WAU78_13295 [Roseiarcus sp.]|jgi:hypothetical protein